MSFLYAIILNHIFPQVYYITTGISRPQLLAVAHFHSSVYIYCHHIYCCPRCDSTVILYYEI